MRASQSEQAASGYANNVTLDFSRPGKPTDNGFIDAFNSKQRVECLNAHWFLTGADSREKLETWHRYSIEDRPRACPMTLEALMRTLGILKLLK